MVIIKFGSYELLLLLHVFNLTHLSLPLSLSLSLLSGLLALKDVSTKGGPVKSIDRPARSSSSSSTSPGYTHHLYMPFTSAADCCCFYDEIMLTFFVNWVSSDLSPHSHHFQLNVLLRQKFCEIHIRQIHLSQDCGKIKKVRRYLNGDVVVSE